MILGMELAAILSRIEARLKATELTANEASRRAGKPDAIRNLRRAVENGMRRGISTATLSALAPVLSTSQAWLLTGRDGAEAEGVAIEAAFNPALAPEEANLAMAWAFEALGLGTEAECRVLARAVLRAIRTPPAPGTLPSSPEEKRLAVLEAIRLFRPSTP